MPSVVESDPPAIDSLAEVDRHDQGFILKRYRPNIGAVVSGIDLNKPIGQAAKKALYQALLDHGVLFFRDQEVEPDRYLEFVRIFGNTGPGNPYFPSLPGYPQIEVLESNAAGTVKTDVWHADVTWRKDPPKATVLYARTVPEEGGDTVWSSSVRAYERLDPDFARYLEKLIAKNTFEVSQVGEYLEGKYGGAYAAPGGAERLAQARRDYPPIEVPVIKTHPETGKKVIFVNEHHTSHISNVTTIASMSLLNLIYDVIKTPDIQARFTWRPGSIAVWDNRQVQHYAIRDYGNEHRLMHRVTIEHDGVF